MSEHPVRSLYHLVYEKREPGCWKPVDSIDDATIAVIRMYNGPYTTEVVFDLGSDELSKRTALDRRRQVEALLRLAYDAGDRAARLQIRQALGVQDLRR